MTQEIIIFGLICLALAGLAVVAVATPMWRGRAAGGDATDTDIDIYRDQLAEVDRDLDRGVLDAAEAERTRTEISRRLLAADASARAAGTDAPRSASRIVAGVMAMAVLATAGGLYWTLGAPGYGDLPRQQRIAAGEERRENRPNQSEAEAANPIPDALAMVQPETQDIIRALRATTVERPDDVQGWAYLAQIEASVGNIQRAARAQERLITLLGDQTLEADYVRLMDFLVIGARGYVSPESERIALTLLRQNPENQAALYYAGLMYAQNDRPDRAFGLWQRIIENGDPEEFHWQLAAGQIEDVALQIGMDYALPSRRGPSAGDLAAAEDMTPEDRQAMIQGMVGGLADRLATDGGPPQDWARLITALGVLGHLDAARNIAAEAEEIFAADVQAVMIIRRAAAQAGLNE